MNYSAIASLGVLAAVSGCAAPTTDADHPQPGTTAQADSVIHQYTVRLHQLNVSRTRAKNADTITVMMAAIVDGQTVAEKSYSLGDHGHGAFWPLLPLTFQAGNDANVKVVASVVNDHDPNDAASKTVNVLDQISDEAEKFVNGVYPAGPVWPAVNGAIHSVNGWFAGGCDGAVAADALVGTGQGFDDRSAGGVSYGNVQRHDGTNSPWYCGATSLYFTQYSITRDW